MLKSNLLDMNEFLDAKLVSHVDSEKEEKKSDEEDSAMDPEEKAKEEEKKEFMQEVDSDSIQSSGDDEETIKLRAEAKKKAHKMKKIKAFIENKNKRSNAQKTAEMINIFAIGDENQVTAEKLTNMLTKSEDPQDPEQPV